MIQTALECKINTVRSELSMCAPQYLAMLAFAVQWGLFDVAVRAL